MPVAFEGVAFVAACQAVARLVRDGISHEKATWQEMVERGICSLRQVGSAVAAFAALSEDLTTRTVRVLGQLQAEPKRE